MAELERGLTAIQELARKLTEPPYLTLTTIARMAETAISFGAGIYNDGDAAGCYTLYSATAIALEQLAIEHHEAGAPVSVAAREVLEDIQRAATRASAALDDAQSAWMMRHAFDKAIVSQQLASERVQWMMRLSEAAFNRGDYGGSADAMSTAIQTAPELFDVPSEHNPLQLGTIALLYHGHAMLLVSEWEQAYDSITQGIIHAPTIGGVGFDLKALGEHYFVFRDRLDDLEALEPDEPGQRRGLFLRSYLHMFSGELDRARELLTMHLTISPHDEAAQYLLAASATEIMA